MGDSGPRAADASTQPDEDRKALIRLEGVSKRYGETQALNSATLSVSAGEVVGIVGHNGAGKSTLMRILAGLVTPDEGAVVVGGEDTTRGYSFGHARTAGVRIAFQELSLCPALRVLENVLVAHPALRRTSHRRLAEMISCRLDEIFPGHGVSPRVRVSTLTLAQRQMLEIARATLAVGPQDAARLLILDEPTSALGAEAAGHLYAFLGRARDGGLGVVLISHKLSEIVERADRIIVMRDGRVVAERPAAGLSRDAVVELMGQVASADIAAARVRPDGERPAAVTVTGLNTDRLREVSLRIGMGEVVGLAGLEGQGQRALLRSLWHAGRHRVAGIELHGRPAYVSGDRQDEGIFPLWSLGENITLSTLGALRHRGLIQPAAEIALVRDWIERIAIKGAPQDPVGALSGGTQQKAVIARALASGAVIILFDDPFRGVDIGTKRQLYRLVHEEAAKGRSFVWFTTENDELLECDRAYVFRDHTVVAELQGAELTEERVIAASFREEERDALAARAES